MRSETLLQALSLLGCLWQSTLFIVLKLLISYFLKHRPSRAYQIILLAMIGAAIIPFMSALVKHYDLGIFTPKTTELPSSMPLEEHFTRSVEQDHNMSADGSYSTKSLVKAIAISSILWRTIVVNCWMIITIVLLVRLVTTFIYGIFLVHSSKQSGCEQIQKAADNVALKFGLRDIFITSAQIDNKLLKAILIRQYFSMCIIAPNKKQLMVL
jgi:hypothetical protein